VSAENDDLISISTGDLRAHAQIGLHVYAAYSGDQPLAVHDLNSNDAVEFRLEEVSPRITTSARLKLDAYVSRVLTEMIERFNQQLGR
jgi:hypothetical protein